MRRLMILFVMVFLLFIVGCQSNVCTDTDYRDYDTIGVLNFNGVAYTDFCADDNKVTEYYCNNSKLVNETIFCEWGCEEGKCRNQSIICGGRFNLTCPEGDVCDYSNKVIIQELGICKNELTKEFDPQGVEDYQKKCRIDNRDYYAKKQLVYYESKGYKKVLSAVGQYVQDPGSIGWTYDQYDKPLMYDMSPVSEYVGAVWAMQQGQNTRGPIICENVSAVPEAFEYFIVKHPFLFKNLKPSEYYNMSDYGFVQKN